MAVWFKLRVRSFSTLGCALLIGGSVVSASVRKEPGKYEGSVSFSIKELKDVYYLDEQAPLAFAIANHRPEPLYIHMAEPYVEINDANGVRIRRAPIPEPNRPVPAHYYMEGHGKKIYTVPVREIQGPGVLLGMVPDAFVGYETYLSPEVLPKSDCYDRVL